MCIAVRFVDPKAQSQPWIRAKLVINVPWSVTRSAALYIVRETLRALGVAQHHDTKAVCFCGDPVEVPFCAEIVAAVSSASAISRGREAMRRGA
jgi:hypothetical protein